MARRERRLHHYLWHQSRNMWEAWDSALQQAFADAGWAPPRPGRTRNATGRWTPILDNDSGEDFLFMHRRMIAATDAILADVGDPSYPRVVGWTAPPSPGDVAFPVPPAWDTGDADFNSFLQRVKSSEYYNDTMLPWHELYRDDEFLRSVSLGELGARIEFTIHNMMHMRWCREMDIRPDTMPSPNPTIDPRWDDPSYDWLGDTYSSHVNPLFWKLHGWVDDCIGSWMQANNQQPPIHWKGTWVGKMPGHPAPASLHAMLSINPEIMSGHHDDHDHDHLSEMERLAALVQASGLVCSFYDVVDVPAP